MFFKRHYDLRLQVDMHSHLVPGVDDGSKSLEESLGIIKSLQELGYEKLITTPHISETYYPNKPEFLEEHFSELKVRAMDDLGVSMELGAEYMVDSTFLSTLKSEGKVLSWNGHLLIETSFHNLPMIFEEVIYEIQCRNLIPVYAHPERYPYFVNKWSQLENLKARGVLFQVNAGSFAGLYGTGPMKMAKELLRRGMVDMIGSDVHNIEQVQTVKKALAGAILTKKTAEMTFRNGELF